MYLKYIHKEDLALNTLQWLICHKNQPNYSINSQNNNIFIIDFINIVDKSVIWIYF